MKKEMKKEMNNQKPKKRVDKKARMRRFVALMLVAMMSLSVLSAAIVIFI
ncbi:MAG: hypothetical protein ACK5LV_09475 [Lachnospirales bacterium]